jgi:uncharacterized protein YbcV (DUF1398 family)
LLTRVSGFKLKVSSFQRGQKDLLFAHGRQFATQRPSGGRAAARTARGARAGRVDARGAVAADFDAAAVRADILDSQRSNQPYRDFTRRAMEAGVQGYFAFLRGKRVTYFGRQGDEHTEWFPNVQPTPFTEQDIRAAYAKTKTGADFPRLIRDLKTLGIVSYDHLLETGSNIFHGKSGQSVSLTNMGPTVAVSPQPNLELLKKYISMHQSGQTNYPTLCGQAGEAGMEKWTSDLLAMRCTYFDKSGHKIHVELIPDGEYKK